MATSGLTSHRQSSNPSLGVIGAAVTQTARCVAVFAWRSSGSPGYRNGEWDTAGVRRAGRYNHVAATDWRGGEGLRGIHRARRFGYVEHHRSLGNGLRSGPRFCREQAYLSVTLSVGCDNPGTLFNPARPVEIHIELHQRAVGASIGHTNFIRLSNAGRARSGRFRRKPLLNAARLRTHCYDLPKRI